MYLLCQELGIFSMLADKKFIWAFIGAILIWILFCQKKKIPEEIIVLVVNETGAKEQLNCALMDAMATRAGMKNAFKQSISFRKNLTIDS